MKLYEKAKWIAVGMVALAVIVPTGVAVAQSVPVTALSNLAGTRTVGVTAANQLLASESDPKTAVVIYGVADNGSAPVIYTVPAKQALVIKTITYNAMFTSNDTTAEVNLFVQKAGTVNRGWFSASQGLRQTQSQDLASQLVIQTGQQLFFGASGMSDGGEVWIYGYLIPASAAPNTTVVAGNAPHHTAGS